MEYLIVGLICVFVGMAAASAFYGSERDMRRIPASEAKLPPEVLSILSALPGSAIVLDADGRVLRAGIAALGWRLCNEEAITNPELAELVKQLRSEGHITTGTIATTRSGAENASVVDLSIHVAPLANGHILILAQDVTEVRRAEQMRRDFIGNMSHELKTPIGAISLLSETIADSAEDTEAVRYFAPRLQREARRLSNLVTDIIELSHLQDGGVEEHLSAVNIGDVLSDALEACTVAADNAQINLAPTNWDPAHLAQNPPCVLGSHKQLMTAVRNLVDNAIRYSQPGSTVRTAVSTQGSWLLVAVADQGIGIPEAEQTRIFERFYRVDTDRSRLTGGTGLGLSIVKHVAIDHGGSVSVQSEPGQGATFTLRLPIAPDPEVLPEITAVANQLAEEDLSQTKTHQTLLKASTTVMNNSAA